ncbi:MAG: hypothetical protein ACXQS3_04445 [Candidatus Methanofastidiosia archaeon]
MYLSSLYEKSYVINNIDYITRFRRELGQERLNILKNIIAARNNDNLLLEEELKKKNKELGQKIKEIDKLIFECNNKS